MGCGPSREPDTRRRNGESEGTNRRGGRERGRGGGGGGGGGGLGKEDRLRVYHVTTDLIRHVVTPTADSNPKQEGQPPVTAGGKAGGQRSAKENDENTDVIFALLAGDVTVDCPPSDKVVRIFLSSTFTDTSAERNSLLEHTYPRLKGWLQERGYQFQVVDMRWGVRDEATDDHRTTSLCLREIDLCTRISTGPCFVTLLSHKYGYRSFPTVLKTAEWEQLVAAIGSEDVIRLLTKWFKRDDNTVPPTYVLQPISSQLPDYLSNEKDLRSAAANQWWAESAAMHAAIGQAAVTCLGEAHAHEMMQSVTEAEIRQGMLSEPSLLQRSLWFYRHLDGIDTALPDRVTGRFKDCRGDEATQKESRSLLDSLKSELTTAVPADHLIRYNVQWDTRTGINPDQNPDHKQYIHDFCNDFEQRLKQMAQEAITSRDQDHRVNSLVTEVTQHARFCQEKCRHFYGRQEALKRTLAYLKGSDHQNRPLVIHGKSGSGKTSIVAMAAKQAWRLHQGKGAVVLRFLGTSADSTSVVSLLRSILHQLTAVTSRSIDQVELPTKVKDLSEKLQLTLREMSDQQCPVVILLDSVDQMDPGHGARELDWLPLPLPDRVRVILSTLPDPQYQALPKLQAKYDGDSSNFYEVPTLADNDVSGILDQWLAAIQRRLSANQRELVLQAFKACPLPLFLKLSFDAASKWSSYSLPDTTVLQRTVRESINMVFAEVERLHGKTFVSHALGYLTLSQRGLTEAELEDILSCDNDVLNDVYMYWTPPVRRLPPLLLVRLKADLGQYLVDRGADGVGVFYWYHRQFIEAATDRYCSDATVGSSCHGALADYFSGRWAGGNPKPYTDKKGNSCRADRVVSSQPLMFGDSFNLRKLNNLPFHALQAGNVEVLKSHCLLNFRFLQAKILACGVRTVLEDFSAARKVLGEGEGRGVEVVCQSLQLSQDALTYDPLQLPAQLLARITAPEQELRPFLQQLYSGSDGPFLLPSQPILVAPGGQLLHSLNSHTSDVTCMAMTHDGKFVVTCSYDQSLCVVEVGEGRVERKIEGVGEGCEEVYVCCDDTVIVPNSGDELAGYELSTGNRLWTVEDYVGGVMTFCGPGRSVMVIFDSGEQAAVLFDARTGTELRKVPLPPRRRDISFTAPVAGQERYAITTTDKQDRLILLDTETDKIHISERMVRRPLFPRASDDKDDDDDDSEFTTEGLALAPDGRFVYCSNCVDNDLHVMEVPTFTLVKVLKGIGSDYSEKFHVTSEGRYLYFTNRRMVRVWDLHTDQRASALLHVNMLLEVATPDLRSVVTLADDRLVRIWDLHQGLSEGKPRALEFKDVSVWTPTEGLRAPPASGKEGEGDKEEDEQARDRSKMEIRTMVALDSPRYVLVVSQVREGNLAFLQVYDVAMETYVRRAAMGQSLPVTIHPLDARSVVVCFNQRLRMLDLDRMTLTRSFQGRVGKYPKDCTHLIDGGQAVLTLTKGSHHLKVYSVSTGQVVCVIRQAQIQQPTLPTKLRTLPTVVVNTDSTVAVAETDEDCHLLVFDLKQRAHVHTIRPADMRTEYLSLTDAVLTSEGRHLLTLADREWDDDVTGEQETDTCVMVYDLEKREFSHDLMDLDKIRKHKRQTGSKLDTYCNGIKLLDTDRALTTHDDNCLRVFNLRNGELLMRLEGHQCSPNLYAPLASGLVVSHGSFSQENAFRLWTKRDLTPIVSFSLDDEVDDILLLADHISPVVTSTKSSQDPLLFHLHCPDSLALPGNRAPLTSYPEVFKGKKLSLEMTGLTDTNDVDNEDDPDDDEEVNDDNDSDSGLDDDPADDKDDEASDDDLDLDASNDDLGDTNH